MNDEMKKNLNNEELNKEQLGNVTGGDDRTISGSGGSSPSGGRGGSKKATVICPECSSTVTVTVKAFSDNVICPACKKSITI